MDKYNIKQLLSQDISNIDNILQDFRREYWFDNDHIHKYMELLNIYVSLNGKNIWLFDQEIKYIFSNIKKIAKDNIYINDFLYSYAYFDFFISESFLNYLGKLDILQIDHILLVRLINRYFSEYDRSIILSNHKEFFKKIVEYIYKLPAIHNLSNNYNFIFTFQNLVWKLNYKISEYYKIFFILFEKWIMNWYATAREAGIINNIDEDDFIDTLNKQDLYTKIKIINHLRRDIDFKSLHNLYKFDKHILFYLSLLDSARYFDSSDNKIFLEFCEKFYNLDFNSKLKTINDIQDIDKLIKFLNIYMFDEFFDETFWKFFLQKVFEWNRYRYYINDFIKKYIDILSNNISVIYPIFINIYQESTQREDMHRIITWILEYYTGNFIPYYVTTNYQKIFALIGQYNTRRIAEKIYTNLFTHLETLNNLKYQYWNKYIAALLQELNKYDVKISITQKYEMYKYIKQRVNSKVMYLINKNKKYMKNRTYDNSQFKNMEWRIWRNGRMLIRFYHWIKLILDE